MGFVPEQRRFKLMFTDPALEGLEVLVKSVSIGEFLEITGLDDATALGPVTLRDDAPLRIPLLTKFAGCIVEWNLGPGDKPFPATVQTLREQEVGMVRAMVKAWLEAVSGVAPPLSERSAGGQFSPEDTTALAELSKSLQS
jgi:hypothetical protein